MLKNPILSPLIIASKYLSLIIFFPVAQEQALSDIHAGDRHAVIPSFNFISRAASGRGSVFLESSSSLADFSSSASAKVIAIMIRSHGVLFLAAPVMSTSPSMVERGIVSVPLKLQTTYHNQKLQ